MWLPCWVTNLTRNLRYFTDARWFNLSKGWRSSSPRMQRKTGYTPLQWLQCEEWMATKLAGSYIICWLSCVGCHAESLSQAVQVSHQQLRSFKQDWKWSTMTFLRNLWQGLSRTFVNDCKHAYSRLADTLNIQCDWLSVYVASNPFP